MLDKFLFQKTLETAQWMVAQTCSLAPEKLNTYWEEFKGISLTDDQFSDCVKAVSRESKFFPKVAEIWEEVNKLKSKYQVPIFYPVKEARGTPKPEWFDEVVAQGKAEQKDKQDKLNGGKYIGSPPF